MSYLQSGARTSQNRKLIANRPIRSRKLVDIMAARHKFRSSGTWIIFKPNGQALTAQVMMLTDVKSGDKITVRMSFSKP